LQIIYIFYRKFKTAVELAIKQSKIKGSTHRSHIVESIPSCDLVGKAAGVRMVFVGVDLDVEGVRDDLSALGQALAHQTRQEDRADDEEAQSRAGKARARPDRPRDLIGLSGTGGWQETHGVTVSALLPYCGAD